MNRSEPADGAAIVRLLWEESAAVLSALDELEAQLRLRPEWERAAPAAALIRQLLGEEEWSLWIVQRWVGVRGG